MKKILKVVLLLTLCVSALTSCVSDAGETVADVSETMETTSEELTTIAETTSEETTEMTTEKITTSEITTEEVTETTPEETSLTIPDKETILASLSDEEKEVWLSMPDIVTVRILARLDNDDNFLYSEVVYIDKSGQRKKFIYPDKPPHYDDFTIEWINDNINQNTDAELIDVVNIHTLVKFYDTITHIGENHTLYQRGGHGPAPSVEVDRHYYFKLFGVKKADDEDSYEPLVISGGDAEFYYVQRNYIRTYEENKPYLFKDEDIDTYGQEAIDLYLKLDPFIVFGVRFSGHLTGEEG